MVTKSKAEPVGSRTKRILVHNEIGKADNKSYQEKVAESTKKK